MARGRSPPYPPPVQGSWWRQRRDRDPLCQPPPNRATPWSVSDVFSRIGVALSGGAQPRRGSPPQGSTVTSEKGTRAPELDSAHLPAPLPLYIGQRTPSDECPHYVFLTLFG